MEWGRMRIRIGAGNSGGRYNWTASFSGDGNNSPASTACGAETVTITRISQITTASATCSQFAAGTAPTLSRIGYTTKKNKIETRTPGGFDHWLTLTANGSAQRFTVTQFTNETSSPFLLIPGSSGYTAACAGVSISTSQVGGAVTFVVPAAPQGTTSYVELRFSTGNVIGEASPKPSSTVEYLFITGGIPGSTRELKLG